MKRQHSIVLMPGRKEDDRIWGSLLASLRECGEVLLRTGPSDLDGREDVVLVASADAASAAVHAAQDGTVRALILLMPTPAELLPDLDLDHGSVVREAIRDLDWLREVLELDDPEQRRVSLADGMLRMMGSEFPAEDGDRIHEMIRDNADVILTRTAPADRPRPYAEALRTLDVPVLFVGVGQNDLAAAYLRAMLGRTAHGELLLLDTATTPYPWLAKPDEAAAAVRDFLARLASPG